MAVLLAGKTDSYAQFITVLAVFVLVLAVTAAVTKWIAGYQKQQCGIVTRRLFARRGWACPEALPALPHQREAYEVTRRELERRIGT